MLIKIFRHLTGPGKLKKNIRRDVNKIYLVLFFNGNVPKKKQTLQKNKANPTLKRLEFSLKNSNILEKKMQK